MGGFSMNCLKCGNNISETLEEGINGSDFYTCDKCHLGFNVLTSDIDEDRGLA